MEGTIGEIRIFASNFAPRTWAFCQGQVLAINQNTALFSILGNSYGGDGRTTFALPDFRGRAALGAGKGNGLSTYSLGEATGTEHLSLTTAEMPSHTHPAIVQPGSGSGGTTGTLYGVNGSGGISMPGGNFIGEDNGAGVTSYASAGTPVPMHEGSIQISNVTSPLPSVMTGMTGSGMPHNNIQPSLVLNYIVCLYGTFPYRS